MTDQEILRQISDYFGILPSYCDFSGQERVTSDETRKAFLAANGVDVSSNAAIADVWYNLRTEADQRWFPTGQNLRRSQTEKKQPYLAQRPTRSRHPSLQRRASGHAPPEMGQASRS